jgi:argininosuccinate lyase
MRLWGGRFAEENDRRVADFTRSIELDRELAADDIAGSIAHVRALGRAGLLTETRSGSSSGDWRGWPSDVVNGSITWDPDLEDVHLNLESALADRIGAVAGKLQTGRSRNDQVATDLRLWSRRAIDRLDEALVAFEGAPRHARRARGDRDPSRHHPHPARPAGAVRSSPARVRRDGPNGTDRAWPTCGGG